MEKEQAKILWNSIVNFASASYELGEEGNSGEFHEQTEWEKLRDIQLFNQKELIEEFSKLGWKPVTVANFYRYETDLSSIKWDLEKID